MFKTIEDAIKAHLKDSGLMPADEAVNYDPIDPKDLTRWTRGTVIDAVVTGGSHDVDNYETRQRVNISVVVVTECPKTEEARRKKSSVLIQAIVGLLSGRDMGLDIMPLTPGRFQETTTEELDKIGIMSWQINFTTDYSIDMLPAEELSELLGFDVGYNGQEGDTIDTEEEPENGF